MQFAKRFGLWIVLLAAIPSAILIRNHSARLPGDQGATYSKVEDKLYVGGRVDAPPPGTDAVVCLSTLKDPYNAKFQRWQPIPDEAPAPSLVWLASQVAFIARHRNDKQQVYIHCDAGLSRGPMVTTAYLMWEHRWSRNAALNFLREHRENAYPNRAFMVLLLDWERAVLGRQPVTTQFVPASFAPSRPSQ